MLSFPCLIFSSLQGHKPAIYPPPIHIEVYDNEATKPKPLIRCRFNTVKGNSQPNSVTNHSLMPNNNCSSNIKNRREFRIKSLNCLATITGIKI